MIEITISTGGVTEIDFTDSSAANAAVTAKNETEQLKADVVTLKSDTQGLRDAAEGFKNTAETKAGEASTDAGVAVTARQGAESARNAINERIDFTGALKRNGLVHDGTKFIPSTFLNALRGSPFNALFYADKINEFDNFDRADVQYTSNGALLGPTDGGGAIEVAEGEMRISSNRLTGSNYPASGRSFAWIGTADSNGYKTNITTILGGKGNAAETIICSGKDKDNFFYGAITQQDWKVYQVIGGVTTQIGSGNWLTSRYRSTTFQIRVVLHQNTNKNDLFFVFEAPLFNVRFEAEYNLATDPTVFNALNGPHRQGCGTAVTSGAEVTAFTNIRLGE